MDEVIVNITDLLNGKRDELRGDQVSVEQQLRDLFPEFSPRYQPGNLLGLVQFIAKLQTYYVTVQGLQFPKPSQGIQPDNRPDPRLEDPWRREGDNPETMNDVRLDRT